MGVDAAERPEFSSVAGTIDPKQLMVDGVQSSVRKESTRHRAERWFYGPLRSMGHDEGYILVMVLLALYERWYRVVHDCDDLSFTDGHMLFSTLGGYLGLSASDATDFWRMLRNGLTHRALPNKRCNLAVEFTRNQAVPVEMVHAQNGRLIRVNPLALRDTLLPILERDEAMWDDDTAPLPVEYDVPGG